jgi:hypothetical protein
MRFLVTTREKCNTNHKVEAVIRRDTTISIMALLSHGKLLQCATTHRVCICRSRMFRPVRHCETSSKQRVQARPWWSLLCAILYEISLCIYAGISRAYSITGNNSTSSCFWYALFGCDGLADCYSALPMPLCVTHVQLSQRGLRGYIQGELFNAVKCATVIGFMDCVDCMEQLCFSLATSALWLPLFRTQMDAAASGRPQIILTVLGVLGTAGVCSPLCYAIASLCTQHLNAVA